MPHHQPVRAIRQISPIHVFGWRGFDFDVTSDVDLLLGLEKASKRKELEPQVFEGVDDLELLLVEDQ